MASCSIVAVCQSPNDCGAMRMDKTTSVWRALLCTVLIAPSVEALADSCISSRTYRTESAAIRADYREATAVFAGRVISTPDLKTIEFAVLRRWKGIRTPSVIVRNYALADPREFEVGGVYLVFGSLYQDHISIDSCARVERFESEEAKEKYGGAIGTGRGAPQ